MERATGFIIGVATLTFLLQVTYGIHETGATTNKRNEGQKWVNEKLHSDQFHKRNMKYTSILSVDGGGMRNILSLVVLSKIERTLKSCLKASRLNSSSSHESFDMNTKSAVFLADYFDVVSGSASGAWISMYLASKGTDGTLKKKLEHPEIVKKYGRAVPGTAGALMIWIREYGTTLYPKPPPKRRHAAEEASKTSGPSITEPKYSSEGVRIAMEALFGENTLLDQQTTSLTPMTNLETGAMETVITDFLHGSQETGVWSYDYSNPTDPVKSTLLPVSKFKSGVNFLLRDVGQGCSAGPTIFPAINVTSVSGPPTRIFAADGYFNVAGNTALVSFNYAAHRLGINAIEQYAILSVGGGAGVGQYADNANGGTGQWYGTVEYLQISLVIAGNEMANMLDLLYARNPNVKPGQHLRIQTFADIGTVKGDILGDLDRTEAALRLRKYGKDLAAQYAGHIKSFIQNFILV